MFFKTQNKLSYAKVFIFSFSLKNLYMVGGVLYMNFHLDKLHAVMCGCAVVTIIFKQCGTPINIYM